MNCFFISSVKCTESDFTFHCLVVQMLFCTCFCISSVKCTESDFTLHFFGSTNVILYLPLNILLEEKNYAFAFYNAFCNAFAQTSTEPRTCSDMLTAASLRIQEEENYAQGDFPDGMRRDTFNQMGRFHCCIWQ